MKESVVERGESVCKRNDQHGWESKQDKVAREDVRGGKVLGRVAGHRLKV